MAIIWGGPAGLLLSELLHRRGVASVVLEKHSRAHVLSRIRAGVLEQTTVDVLRSNGLAERMDREGQPHDGMKIVWAGRDGFFIDVAKHVGKRFMTYGQTHTVLHEFEKVYPFGWLGILSQTPPLPDIIYANHPRGFALASARSPNLSRYYIQVSSPENPAALRLYLPSFRSCGIPEHPAQET